MCLWQTQIDGVGSRVQCVCVADTDCMVLDRGCSVCLCGRGDCMVLDRGCSVCVPHTHRLMVLDRGCSVCVWQTQIDGVGSRVSVCVPHTDTD